MPTRHDYLTVDVFTDRVFAGNPLAVVTDATGLSPAQMQAIAAEFNYSESTFVLPPDDPTHTARVRIFTRQNEIPFAGHPNVGTAFTLARLAERRGQTLGPALLFEEGAGLVPVDLMRDTDARVIGATLTARSRSPSTGGSRPRWWPRASGSMPQQCSPPATSRSWPRSGCPS
jgi:trans-2,3-dihydro-3-hydroxyanthranilate isomerase